MTEVRGADRHAGRSLREWGGSRSGDPGFELENWFAGAGDAEAVVGGGDATAGEEDEGGVVGVDAGDGNVGNLAGYPLSSGPCHPAFEQGAIEMNADRRVRFCFGHIREHDHCVAKHVVIGDYGDIAQSGRSVIERGVDIVKVKAGFADGDVEIGLATGDHELRIFARFSSQVNLRELGKRGDDGVPTCGGAGDDIFAYGLWSHVVSGHMRSGKIGLNDFDKAAVQESNGADEMRGEVSNFPAFIWSGEIPLGWSQIVESGEEGIQISAN